jgi:hypothetical protein
LSSWHFSFFGCSYTVTDFALTHYYPTVTKNAFIFMTYIHFQSIRNSKYRWRIKSCYFIPETPLIVDFFQYRDPIVSGCVPFLTGNCFKFQVPDFEYIRKGIFIINVPESCPKQGSVIQRPNLSFSAVYKFVPVTLIFFIK